LVARAELRIEFCGSEDFYLRAVHRYWVNEPAGSLFQTFAGANMVEVEARRHLSPYAFYTAAGPYNYAMILYAQRTLTILRMLGVQALVASLAVTWQESCENPSIFCYRVGRRIFTREAA
jgi:hypothetical protein